MHSALEYPNSGIKKVHKIHFVLLNTLNEHLLDHDGVVFMQIYIFFASQFLIYV